LGEPVTASTVDKDFKRLLARAGLERSHRPHDLRHSCATYLLAAGVSEKEIMDILGHTNLAMTRHYEHVLDGMRAAAADRLETWFSAHIGTAEAPWAPREGTPVRRAEGGPESVGTPEGTPGGQTGPGPWSLRTKVRILNWKSGGGGRIRTCVALPRDGFTDRCH
jgi:Phage integrase family